MTAEITIPPAALEAVARAYAVANDTPELWWRLYEEKSRAALLAGLKAWPGMGPIRTDQPIGDWCDKLPAIILPLPQEGEETDQGKPQGKEGE